jgi:hypothetical protein
MATEQRTILIRVNQDSDFDPSFALVTLSRDLLAKLEERARVACAPVAGCSVAFLAIYADMLGIAWLRERACLDAICEVGDYAEQVVEDIGALIEEASRDGESFKRGLDGEILSDEADDYTCSPDVERMYLQPIGDDFSFWFDGYVGEGEDFETMPITRADLVRLGLADAPAQAVG